MKGDDELGGMKMMWFPVTDGGNFLIFLPVAGDAPEAAFRTFNSCPRASSHLSWCSNAALFGITCRWRSHRFPHEDKGSWWLLLGRWYGVVDTLVISEKDNTRYWSRMCLCKRLYLFRVDVCTLANSPNHSHTHTCCVCIISCRGVDVISPPLSSCDKHKHADKQSQQTRRRRTRAAWRTSSQTLSETYCDGTMSLLELIQEGREVLSGLLHSLSASTGPLTRDTRSGGCGPAG